ncbi:membrane protein insertase YidC [Nigerium massiliense]|uniref:membrane protein insertase YidC n=1 Tax=Nigerium massiliense TaxID=1522317 RepID=UPI00059025A5
MLPLLIPLNIWDSFLGGLNTMMQPIYWAISGIIVGFHWLFSRFMNPDSGWTWALAIISLTVVVRSLMIPLFVRQINTSRKMQLLGPKIKALQDKYGTDRERLGQETMKLYKEENVNPAASCLPLLLQMPIFIGLFNVLNSVSRGHAQGEFFVREPALVDSLRHAKIFGAEISGTFLPITTIGPTQFVAAFLIIAMTATLFFTQLHMMRKNMPPESLEGPMAQQQKMMLYMFPVIYLITGVSIPIGVMIYWLASNLWTLGQQYLLVHNSPAPNTPAYIDWEERMLAKGKDPEAILRKRMGYANKPKATTSNDPTRVARQSTPGTTTTKSKGASAAGRGKATTARPSERSTAGPASSTHARVQRQQPSKGTRATRKQAKRKE